MQGNANTSCDCSAGQRGFWTSGVRGGHYFHCRKRGATKASSWFFCPRGRSKWIGKEMLSRLSRSGLQEGVNQSSRSQMGMRKQNVGKRNVAWTRESRRCMLFGTVLLRGQQRSWCPMATDRNWRRPDAGCATFIDLCVTSVLGRYLLMWARADWERRHPRASALFCNSQDAETRKLTRLPCQVCSHLPGVWTSVSFKWGLKNWPGPD